MKKIILILILSIVKVITCQAQLTHSNKFVKISLPNNAYKMNKQQVDALTGFKLLSKSKIDYSPPYHYKIDNLTLSFFNVNQDSINNNLPRKKIFQDELYLFLRENGNNTYKSIIESVKGNRILLISYNIDQKGRYEFFCQNETKTLMQAGYIDYPRAESIKAEALLNEVLNSIEFAK